MLAEDLTPYLNAAERFLAPLLRAVEDPEQAELLLKDLGYAPPSQSLAFRELGGAASSLTRLLDSLEHASDEGDAAAIAARLAEFVVELGRLFGAINTLQSSIEAEFEGTDFLAQTDISAAVGRKLTDYLAVRFLEDHHGLLGAVLAVVGIVDVENVDETPTPFHVAYVKRTVNWDRVPSLFSDPVATIRSNFAQGGEFLYERLLFLLNELGASLGLPTTYDFPSDPVLTALNRGRNLAVRDDYDELNIVRLRLVADPDVTVALEFYPLRNVTDGKYTGLGVGLRIDGDVEIPISDAYRMTIKAKAGLSDGLGLAIDQAGQVTFVDKLFSAAPGELAESVRLAASIGLSPTPEGSPDPLFRFGTAQGSRLEIGSGSLTLGVEKLDSLRFFMETELRQGTLALNVAEADSFISSFLSDDGIQTTFDLGLGISSDQGFYFHGSSSLQVRLPLHMNLGPLQIHYLGLGVELEGSRVPLTITTGLSLKLGPIAAAVDDVGIRATFESIPNRSGNLGPLDVDLEFKPPSGVGLVIDAGLVKGGGYLRFDPERGEYGGVAELSIAELVTVKAIGLISTKMPDGSKGFSLLVIISAEFQPIQLGFGFTLNAVGGLLGLNRSAMLDVLREGVRTGAVNSIMFPTDVAANAPRIISDLKAVFPPEEGTFLIGPMAKLAWGTPSLVTLSLGIIVEIPPGNIAILGVLKVVLPDEDAALIQLQVNFVGTLDFDKKLLAFDASLFDSRILFMTLSGDMAVRLKWGDNAGFLLSVGGFHPSFQPPPLSLPTLRRIRVSILDYDWARIRIDSYFAVTSNTVQFGARADLFFGVDGCRVSGDIGYDVLFQFSPFYFNALISGSLHLEVIGVDVMSIRLRLSLEGPTPWRAKGSGSVSILFWDIDVDFDVTWGDRKDTSLPPVQVMSIFIDEVKKQPNWKALQPPSSNLLVSMRKLDPALLVLHPFGAFTVTQRAVPLGITLDKLGNQKPDDVSSVDISSATTGNTDLPLSPVQESFAPAQFQQMSDAEKLSRPSFQDLKGGVTVGTAGGPKSSKMTRRQISYEITIIDKEPTKPLPRGRFHFVGTGLFNAFLRGASVSRSALSFEQRTQLKPYPDKIVVSGAGFTVATSHDNRPFNAQSRFASEAMATDFMRRQLDLDPSLMDAIHVLPNHEVNPT